MDNIIKFKISCDVCSMKQTYGFVFNNNLVDVKEVNEILEADGWMLFKRNAICKLCYQNNL